MSLLPIALAQRSQIISRKTLVRVVQGVVLAVGGVTAPEKENLP